MLANAFIVFDIPVPPSTSPLASFGNQVSRTPLSTAFCRYQPQVSWHQVANPVDRHSCDTAAMVWIAAPMSVTPSGRAAARC